MIFILDFVYVTSTIYIYGLQLNLAA